MHNYQCRDVTTVREQDDEEANSKANPPPPTACLFINPRGDMLFCMPKHTSKRYAMGKIRTVEIYSSTDEVA